jgi:hypothetical protein
MWMVTPHRAASARISLLPIPYLRRKTIRPAGISVMRLGEGLNSYI